MGFEILEKEYLKVKDDSLSFVRFFESNSNAIEKLDDSDEEEKGFKLRLHGDYGLCLANSGTTEKAVKVLETYIPRFEKESGLAEADLLATPYYEHLLWAFGSSLYYTNRIDETERTFERLVKMRPDNQKYKNWLKGTIGKRFSKISKGLYVSIFVWIAIEIIFYESVDSGLKEFFLLTGAILLGGAGTLEIYVYLLKRRVR